VSSLEFVARVSVLVVIAAPAALRRTSAGYATGGEIVGREQSASFDAGALERYKEKELPMKVRCWEKPKSATTECPSGDSSFWRNRNLGASPAYRA